MEKAAIRTIPSCVVYRAEYDVEGIDSFFNLETGDNILYDLQYMMEDENPDVTVPEIGDDYNFFDFPFRDNGDGTVHIVYSDKVDKPGKDNPDGAYRFVIVPEMKAAVLKVTGPFDDIGKGYDALLEWLESNGMKACGNARISAIHGPWDREEPAEYVNEVQIPVR